MEKLKFGEMTEKIIEAAFEVHKFLGNACLAGRRVCKSVIQTSYIIVKAHGGNLSLTSKINEGTTFIIELTK